MSINVTRSSMPDFEEYVNEIRGLWDSRWLTNMGEKHRAFEQQLKERLGVPYVTLFTNGHLALEEVIASFGFPRGSEVITTPFTFVSTTHAIMRNGLVPVFCDIDPTDFTMDPAGIEALITERTAAIVPVHVYGNVCHVEEIAKIAERHGLKVIYDAAHTFGVRRRDPGSGMLRSACDYGDASILSFHATKVFHTIEGGAAVCHSEKQREILDDLKNFGIRDQVTCAYIGGNAKMSEFQAAMGICNLRHIDEEIGKRRAVYEHYAARLRELPGIVFWTPQEGVEPNYAYLPVRFPEPAGAKAAGAEAAANASAAGAAAGIGKSLRDRVYDALRAEDITARRYFYPLTSDYECYDELRTAQSAYADTPVARRVASEILTLPIYADLAMEDVDRICNIVENCVTDAVRGTAADII